MHVCAREHHAGHHKSKTCRAVVMPGHVLLLYTHLYIERERERERERNIYVHINVFICRYVCKY